METVDLYAEAWAGIEHSFATDRLAHAYVVVGSPRGDALRFVESFLKLLFCAGTTKKPCNDCVNCKLMDSHKHVDTLWIEPQSKSRQIKADEIRGLVHRITQTSFEGGWKAGILVSAECMNTASANILLKTLEEPPPKTVLFLITDSPQALLPTIISRCQKIVLSKGSDGTANANWNASLMELLRDMPPKNGLAAARLAGQLKAIFDVVKAEISDAVDADFDADEGLDESKLKEIFDSRVSARLKEVQAEVFRVLLDWHRDILMLVSGVNAEHLIFSADHDVLAKQAVRHTQASILQAMEIVETMARRLERNISPVQIFDEAFRRLVRR